MARLLRGATHRATGLFRWVLSVVLGFALVVLGVVMLFTPGPGLAAIVLGLYVWAWQFAWARRLLDALVTRIDARRDKLPAFVGRLLDQRLHRLRIRQALEEDARRSAAQAATDLPQSSGRT